MILEMRDICKDYPMGKSVAHILKNVNLDVEEGEYLAIMGPSGSGKTTLMNLIGCLDVPTSGSYLLGGRDVTTCNNKQLAEVRNKELGFVFQSFNLLPKLTAHPHLAGAVIYCWQDSKTCFTCGEDDCPCETAWGITRADGTHKPAYEAIGEAFR